MGPVTLPLTMFHSHPGRFQFWVRFEY